MLHVDSGGSSPNLTLGRTTGWCVPLGQTNRAKGLGRGFGGGCVAWEEEGAVTGPASRERAVVTVERRARFTKSTPSSRAVDGFGVQMLFFEKIKCTGVQNIFE